MKKIPQMLLSLSVLSFLMLLMPSWGEQTNAQLKSADYKMFTTRHQVVDEILSDALKAFHSPSRKSSSGYTARLPNNLEIVTQKLMEAYKLEPYRTDFLISAANAQIFNKNAQRAIKILNQASIVAPEHIDIQTYLTVWYHLEGDKKESNEHLATLKKLDPSRAQAISDLFKKVERISKKPLKNKLKKPYKGEHIAIVALGYGLGVDGRMLPTLLARLNKTLEIAKAEPNALIITTGGVPKAHKTEGKSMADWLIAHGINRSRIVEDNYATDTVENGIFTSYILARAKIQHATIVSSAGHVRRAQTIFEILAKHYGPSKITFDTLSSENGSLDSFKTPSKGELLGIYRDSLRAMGMRSYDSYPLVMR